MTLYEARVRARRLGYHIYKVSKSRLKIKYRISNYYCRNVSELSKAITKLERAKRKEEIISKLNGHRLKRGYKLVPRRRRKKGRHPKRKNGKARAEYERRAYKSVSRNGIIKRVRAKGGIKCTSAVRDFGSCNDIPLCCRRKYGLPLDEMADELKMSDERLWEALTRR